MLHNLPRMTESDMDKRDLDARITQMEQLFDEVLSALKLRPDTIASDQDIQTKIQTLKDYYENGKWLCDYERDERGELSRDLKRGVLAQDTLYDLFSTLDQLVQSDEINSGDPTDHPKEK